MFAPGLKNNEIDKRMSGSCERLSWVGSRKKPDNSPPSARGEPMAELLFVGSGEGEDRGRGRCGEDI
ncbi:hypothetical protein YC2023_077044 [Brassica napus]